jgi:hypothetical protein
MILIHGEVVDGDFPTKIYGVHMSLILTPKWPWQIDVLVSLVYDRIPPSSSNAHDLPTWWSRHVHAALGHTSLVFEQTYIVCVYIYYIYIYIIG